jgi:DNA-binding transcriptional regulator YdaS (Cro superfamily)
MPSKPTPEEALQLAIDAAGGLRALARRLEISAPSIIGWRTGGVPAERVLPIEKETGVSRHFLRPDIYPSDRVA